MSDGIGIDILEGLYEAGVSFRRSGEPRVMWLRKKVTTSKKPGGFFVEVRSERPKKDRSEWNGQAKRMAIEWIAEERAKASEMITRSLKQICDLDAQMKLLREGNLD